MSLSEATIRKQFNALHITKAYFNNSLFSTECSVGKFIISRLECPEDNVLEGRARRIKVENKRLLVYSKYSLVLLFGRNTRNAFISCLVITISFELLVRGKGKFRRLISFHKNEKTIKTK